MGLERIDIAQTVDI